MKSNICQVCNSDKGVRSFKDKRVCGKHRQQLSKYGEIRYRTLATGNDFHDKNTHYEVVIYDRNCKEKARTLIDRIDRERVGKVGSWCLGKGGYPMNGRIKMSLHRFLLGKRKGLEIDHINGNKLDNRRINLRFVKHAVNTQSWVSVYKRKILSDFQAHLAEGKDVEGFFKQLLS